MASRKFAGKKNPTRAATTELLAYKFRGYPSEEAEAVLWQNIHGCRSLWNLMCADAEQQYRDTHAWRLRTPAFFKQLPEYSWLKELDSCALVRVQMHFDMAMSAFFSKEAGHPVKKRRKSICATYTTCIANAKAHNLKLEGDLLKLPKVAKAIPLKLHRKIRQGGILKSCTVSHEADGWYFSLLYEYPTVKAAPVAKPEPTHIGLDMSLSKLYVDSRGKEPGHSKSVRKSEVRLAKLEERLRRKLKANTTGYTEKAGRRYPVYKKPLGECRNIQKLNREIDLLRARIKHQRGDFLHKLTKQLTDQYELISIEELSMREMGMFAKAGNAAAVAAWMEFIRQLRYKQERKGHVLLRVGAQFPSVRICPRCGYVHREDGPAKRKNCCPTCGSLMDRDFQVAENIDREGLRIYREKQASA